MPDLNETQKAILFENALSDLALNNPGIEGLQLAVDKILEATETPQMARAFDIVIAPVDELRKTAKADLESA